jgi:ATP-binding cassette subfamily B protein
MFDLRRQLMGHMQTSTSRSTTAIRWAAWVTRVTTDVDVLNDLFASGLVTILGDLLVLVFILGIMFSFSPLLTAIMLTAMPFVILTTVIFRRSVTESYRRIRCGHRQGSTRIYRSTSPVSSCCNSSIASRAQGASSKRSTAST